MKICEIHEVRPEFLDIDLSDFDILTFDDGLVSQYWQYKHFLQFKKPMIFFISTGIVNVTGCQCPDILNCAEAHARFFSGGDTSPYMTWEQIKEIAGTAGCEIGGHSHSHPDLQDLPVLQQVDRAMQETKKMVDTFAAHRMQIQSFCYPYNYAAPGYKFCLFKAGIKNLYGAGRIPIETLISK